MKILIILIIIILLSLCVNNSPEYDYTSDVNSDAFNIIPFNAEGVISGTTRFTAELGNKSSDYLGCGTPPIALNSYLARDVESQCISLGPVRYWIIGTSICGGVRATVFEKIEQNEMCGNWYHVRLENGEEGWLSQNFFSEKVCSTNEDCTKMRCTNPPRSVSCDPANYKFTVCENGLCK